MLYLDDLILLTELIYKGSEREVLKMERAV